MTQKPTDTLKPALELIAHTLPRYGEPLDLGAHITAVLAPNASPFTYTGTHTYLIGDRELFILDPGPIDPAHQAALIETIAGRPVVAILLTHRHRDHSALARTLADTLDCPLYAGPLASRNAHAANNDTQASDHATTHVDDPFERDLAAEPLTTGSTLSLETSTGTHSLTAHHTPGHTPDHVCFHWSADGSLFTGDHIMGWSTTVIAPPDGHMGDYLASLEHVGTLKTSRLIPTHGAPIEKGARFVRHLIGHRRWREQQILSHLASNSPASVAEMTPSLYPGLNPGLIMAAQLSVCSHLLHLEERGLVASEAGPMMKKPYFIP